MDSPLSHLNDAVDAWSASREEIRRQAGDDSRGTLGGPDEAAESALEAERIDPFEEDDDVGI